MSLAFLRTFRTLAWSLQVNSAPVRSALHFLVAAGAVMAVGCSGSTEMTVTDFSRPLQISIPDDGTKRPLGLRVAMKSSLSHALNVTFLHHGVVNRAVKLSPGASFEGQLDWYSNQAVILFSQDPMEPKATGTLKLEYAFFRP